MQDENAHTYKSIIAKINLNSSTLLSRCCIVHVKFMYTFFSVAKRRRRINCDFNRLLPFYGTTFQIRLREESRRTRVDEKEKKKIYTHARTSARSFEREKALSNFQFSQSGPKIRDHAPVMAEVQ